MIYFIIDMIRKHILIMLLLPVALQGKYDALLRVSRIPGKIKARMDNIRAC